MARRSRAQAGHKRKRAKGHARRRRARRLERTIAAAFCLSGFAGLMHQVVWAKLLVGLIGATAHAQAVVLAIFMGGLALGSVLFGSRVDRHGRPLRTYVVLELVIGGYCLLLPLIVWAADSGYVAMAGLFFESVEIKLILRLSLAFSTVLFPAVLMGGTLPILARRLISQVDQTQKRVAGLYALNSFGAVLGAGTAGFVTLPLLGITPSLAIASLLNFAAAALVLAPARSEEPVEAPEAPEPRERKPSLAPTPAYRTDQYVATLAALALSGFAAMGYEVLFTRVIALAFGLSTYSFTVMLMSFITGISLGSAIASRLRVERPLWLLGSTQLVVVVAFLAVTPLISRLPYLIALLRIDLQDARFGFELFQLGKAALCLAVLLLPTTCLGFSFPLVAQVQARGADQVGFRVGSTYAWNTVGNVLGAVGTSLVLIPALGVLGAFHLNFAVSFAAGAVILLVADEVPAMRRLAAGAFAAGAATVQILAGSGWLEPVNFARNHLRLISGPGPGDDAETRARHPASSFEAWKRRYVVPVETAERFFFEEDAHTSVMAYDNGRQVELYVNGKPDASTYGDLPTQLLLGHVPLFLALDARDVLVIGYGSGITTGSALRHPIERADVVEISSAVIAADPLFAEANYRALEDPRVHVTLDDGQSFLRTVPRRYDVIISEPSNPWITGVAGLFTVEFFEAMRDRLNPGGVATVWFHQYEQSDTSVDLVLRSLHSVFPHVLVFRSADLTDIITTASMDPLEPDFAAMELRFDEPGVRNDLARMGVTNLATLLSHHAISAERLPGLLPPGPLNRVRHQRLEYQAPRSFFHSLSSSFLHRSDPLIRGTHANTDVLLDRYAGYRAAEGDPVRRSEFAAVGSLYAHALDPALGARARAAPETEAAATRAARGRIVEPGEMGFYEAVYRAALYTKEGRRGDALPFRERALALRSSVVPGSRLESVEAGPDPSDVDAEVRPLPSEDGTFVSALREQAQAPTPSPAP